MLCPRCGRPAMKLGLVDGGELFSCGFCTNQWIEQYAAEQYEAVSGEVEKKAAELIKNQAIIADTGHTIGVLQTLQDWAQTAMESVSEKAQRAITPQDREQFYGRYNAYAFTIDRIKAEIKRLKGVA